MTAGDRLGPYEILSLIGAGGMGEVYRARDTRLDRVVAIKISREKFSERFEREARAVAALNHPNICHLYDVGPDYLVMEYIDGASLRGPVAADKAVPIALQIAAALEAAHAHGIVHRDLKPANILIGSSGAKLLDFGLAKRDVPVGESDPTANHTQPGEVLGTAAYMSPEQASGKTVDARSDIFSFGAVLYEMLCGQRAFNGNSNIECALPAQHFVQYGSEREDVGARVHRFARRLFRRHVSCRAEHFSRLGVVGRGIRLTDGRFALGQSEVEQLGTGRAYQNVRGFEVSMDNAVCMGCFKGRRDLQRYGHRLVGRDWSPERCAIDVLHDQIIRTDIIKMTDVGVIQSRDGARFALEPFGEFLAGDLDGDHSVQASVACLIDLAHTPGANQGEDLVRT